MKHRRQDWGLLGCQSIGTAPSLKEQGKSRKVTPEPKEEFVWLNKVGTFGISSAAYWWSRLSSGVGRIVMILLGQTWTFMLLYADDVRVSSHGPNKYLQIAKVLFFWEVAGTPISWHKCRGGLEVEWLGYWLDYRGYQLGISVLRRDWLIRWAEGF